MGFSSTSVGGWLSGFAGLIFQSCYARDLSPLPPFGFSSLFLQVPLLELMMGPPWELLFLFSGVFGATSKREALWMIWVLFSKWFWPFFPLLPSSPSFPLPSSCFLFPPVFSAFLDLFFPSFISLSFLIYSKLHRLFLETGIRPAAGEAHSKRKDEAGTELTDAGAGGGLKRKGMGRRRVDCVGGQSWGAGPGRGMWPECPFHPWLGERLWTVHSQRSKSQSSHL